MIVFCCYKSKQIRKQLIDQSDIEKQTNFAIINANEKYKQNMAMATNRPNKKSQSFESTNLKTDSDGNITPKSNENGTDSDEPIPTQTRRQIQVMDKSPSPLTPTKNNKNQPHSPSNHSNLSLQPHPPMPAMYPTDSIREQIANAMKMATVTNYNSYGQSSQQIQRRPKKKKRKKKKNKKIQHKIMVNSRSPTMSAMGDNDNEHGSTRKILHNLSPGTKRMLSDATSTDEFFMEPPNENDEDELTDSDDDAVTADGDLDEMTGHPPKYTEITLQLSGEREDSPDLSEYKWISDTLKKIVSDIKHDLYLKNFRDQMITDKRIKLLWDEDLQLLIPEMGPRREFQNLLNLKGRKPKQVSNNDNDEQEAINVYNQDFDDIGNEYHHHSKQESFVD